MPDDADYESVASMVDSLEMTAGQESAQVEIEDVFADSLKVKRIAYADILKSLEAPEARKAERVQAAAAQPQAAGATRLQGAQAPQRPRPEAPELEVGKEMAGAADRLRSIVGSAGRGLEESIQREEEKREERNLVMPRLSVQDQLSDLEKMAEGLQEGVFDAGQKKIITEEIRWLSSAASRKNLSGMNDEMRELVLLRDQKVKEIKGRLNIR